MTHHLRLLGTPTLESQRLERKTAAVLAYLALEGQTHKYKLAGWLWPDSGETAARNNMRQLLRRLRVAAGEVVRGEDVIELDPALAVDVKQLSYLETPSLEALGQEAELLVDLTFDDAPDFDEWLVGARAELSGLRSRVARGESERLEQAGQLKEALGFVQVWVRLDALSEEAHRSVMRLHYLMGDRGAAILAFERCQRTLRDELGVPPLPETLALLRLIEQGQALEGATPPTKNPTLPTAILRPPVLAGREREWALMEEAWAKGQIIYLVGDPGVGKTRLALDFASSKGKVYHFKARPGDINVPYASQARAIREILGQEPDILERVPRWARLELTRLLPELSEGESLPPLASEADKLRYFEAMAEVNARRSINITVADDVQFADSGTAESSGYMMVKYASNPGANTPRIINVFRRGELRPDVEQALQQLIESGIGTRIDIEPLDTPAINTLLEALPETGLGGLAEALKRFTGGNPLFILETLKDLIESGGLQQGLSARFTPPGKVLALITRRLQRLSPLAQNLARAAAVARTEFSLNLAAAVLQKPAFELAEAHAELEEAQILRGNAFTHDLVFEATQANIPTAVKHVLHASTATYLETIQSNPARIAQHWLEANEGDKATQWLIEAARNASSLGLYKDVLELLERGAQVAVSKELRLEAQVILADSLGPLGRVEESIRLAQTVLRESVQPKLKQRALSVLQNMSQGIGEYEQAEGFIAQALELAEQLGEGDRADGMRFAKARILRHTGCYPEAIALLEQIFPRYETGPSSVDFIQVLAMLGNSYNAIGNHARAEPLLEQALQLSEDEVGPAPHILAMSNWLYGLLCTGRAEEGLAKAEASLALGEYAIGDNLRNILALAYLRLGREHEAATHYRVLAEKAFDVNFKCIAWARLAELSDAPGLAVEQAKNLYPQAKNPTARLTATRAALLHGSSSQRDWGSRELTHIERETLPWLFQPEYDELLRMVEST